MGSRTFGTGPLVVDLDGTLIRSDLLIETAFAELGHRPTRIVAFLSALSRGKAALKHEIAAIADFDPALLPYDPAVLDAIEAARAAGRPVYLASASNERLVGRVADHLGLFDGWFASDDRHNLSGANKAARLIEEFGDKGFDYIGNAVPDLRIWRHSAQALAIGTSASLRRRLDRAHDDVVHLPSHRARPADWLRLMRVHQYAKNLLVFLPIATSHSFSLEAIGAGILAFVAFSLCASAIYILNDLVDIAADRQHPRKRSRPLASGTVSQLQAMAAIPLLLLASFLVAAAISLPFMGAIAGYLALTTAYSFALKRKVMIDVVTLATLYTARVIGGAVAIDVTMSQWLLAFSMFIFTSLALIKRHIELAARLDANLPDAANRDYQTGDLTVVMALAAASGFNAVTVLALYISSDAVGPLYHRPQLLWLACPLLMYWIGRALMQAHRRLLHDDPIIYALKDPVSRYVAIGIAILAALAI